MGNYDELKQAVSDVIKTNGNQEITGQVLQNTLLSIINTVGANATFAGIATPETNPGTPDQNVFYIAVNKGIYSNFNSEQIYGNELVIFEIKDGTWVSNKMSIITTCPIYNISTISNKSFKKRADARIEAVQKGIQFNVGDILQYKLQNGTFIQEIALTNIVASGNETWLDIPFLSEKFSFSFRGNSLVNSHYANNGVLSLVVDGELYFNYEDDIYIYKNEDPQRNSYIDLNVDTTSVTLVYVELNKGDNTFTLKNAPFNVIHNYMGDNIKIVVGNTLKNGNVYSVNVPSMNDIIKDNINGSLNINITFDEIVNNGLITTFSTGEVIPQWKIIDVNEKKYIEATFNAGVNQAINIAYKTGGFVELSLEMEKTSIPIQVGLFGSMVVPSYRKILNAGEIGGNYSFYLLNDSYIAIGALGKDHINEDITIRFRISVLSCQYNPKQIDNDIYGKIGFQNVVNYEIGGSGIELQNRGNGNIIIKKTSISAGFLDSQISTNAKPYWLRIKAKSLQKQKVRIGLISSLAKGDFADIELDSEYKEFSLKFNGLLNDESYNPGITILETQSVINNEIDVQYMQLLLYGTIGYTIMEMQGNDIDNVNNQPITSNTDSFLNSLSRYGKYLTKIACNGDSLIANNIGGNIPPQFDEGETKRPIRLLSNGVPRRLYDFISWNKPEWRRLDNSEWVNDGFVEFTESGMFEGTLEKYWKSTESGNYIEITVPNGFEHFAIVLRTKNGNGKINVTLNGGTIGQYENQYWTEKVETNTIVNSQVVPHYIDRGLTQIDTNIGNSLVGNPYAVFQYNNLPAGDNTIRFTTVDETRVDIWGGFYWSGNTCVVMNIAHGGHTTTDMINEHLEDELYNGGYDSVLFEIPEMNNLRLSLSQSQIDIINIIGRLRDLDINHCYTSCNPLGLSILHDTNFYSIYQNPTQLELNNMVRNLMNTLNEPFVDLFQYFKWNIENRGGTLQGGEGGIWYTHDGQHGNEAGVKMWFDSIKKIIVNKLIMQE